MNEETHELFSDKQEKFCPFGHPKMGKIGKKGQNLIPFLYLDACFINENKEEVQVP